MTLATRFTALAIILVFTSPALLLPLAEDVAAAPSRLPNSMASTGDSITRAFHVCCYPFMDQPAKSWSTGDGKNDGITSHYERILAKNRNINGKNYNDAKSGAKMVDLQGQVNTASVSQKVDYITILMGANDVCTSSKDTMTSTATFRAQFRAAADTIKNSGTAPVVYVLSIPNVYQLWLVGKDDSRARSAWKNYNICQSMLSESNTEEDRQMVLQRNKEFNDILAQESANYGFHWDGYRLFNYSFTLDMLSTIDYFHPNVKGQATLASESWAAGPYAGMA